MERTETSTMIGLHSTQKESGTKVYTCLCYSLWYVNSSHAFFKERGCPTQNLFLKFRGYNYFRKHHEDQSVSIWLVYVG